MLHSLHFSTQMSMSSSKRINKLGEKREPIVQEMEEVKIVDRRGRVRIGMRPVKQDQPSKQQSVKQMPLANHKQSQQKSPSSMASRFTHPFQKSRVSKVYIILNPKSKIIICCATCANIYQQSQNDFLREWITKRESFLQLLLELEGRSDDGLCCQCGASDRHFHCLDCIGNLAHCHGCFMKLHKLLPFHRIQKRTGTYFSKTTLLNQGYILYLGHHREMCPETNDPWLDTEEYLPGTDNVDLLEDTMEEKTGDLLENSNINMVHTTGVFKHKVQWCQCPSAPDKTVQLFQMRLFPASHVWPENAFTFDVLDHFHIDAMECKTAAASFAKKLCHLTNNAFPYMVPVSSNHNLCI